VNKGNESTKQAGAVRTNELNAREKRDIVLTVVERYEKYTFHMSCNVS
jgi:hypothetical protein